MLRPAATKASSSLNDMGSSAVHPKMLPPKTRGATSRLEFPSLRLINSMLLCSRGLRICRRSRATHVSREAGLTATAGRTPRPEGLLTGLRPVRRVWFSDIPSTARREDLRLSDESGPKARFDLFFGHCLRRDQPHVIDPHAPHYVNRARHLGERDFLGAFYEDDPIGALLENICQAWAKRVPVALLLVDHELPVLHHLHNDCIGIGWFGFRLRRLRNQRGQSSGHLRRDHHENDNQHQQHVNQRNYVGLRNRPIFTSTKGHSHDRVSSSNAAPHSSEPRTGRGTGPACPSGDFDTVACGLVPTRQVDVRQSDESGPSPIFQERPPRLSGLERCSIDSNYQPQELMEP